MGQESRWTPRHDASDMHMAGYSVRLPSKNRLPHSHEWWLDQQQLLSVVLVYGCMISIDGTCQNVPGCLVRRSQGNFKKLLPQQMCMITAH
jgi:hypothetical protein